MNALDKISSCKCFRIALTGLGLAIVKHIMQRHSGSVRVQTSHRGGTEFVCQFPQPKN